MTPEDRELVEIAVGLCWDEGFNESGHALNRLLAKYDKIIELVREAEENDNANGLLNAVLDAS